ncbi:MAG TPA: hypothetical protein V6C99_07555 [Oculatellaceae cyanobacterium]
MSAVEHSVQAFRKQVAELFEAVLDERITAQVAINRWPVPDTCLDPSLTCAFWVLWHFEADEVQQQSELYYLDAQLELLRQIAFFFNRGQDLPPYILAAYSGQPPVRFYTARTPWQAYGQNLLLLLKRFLQLWRQAVQCVPGFCQKMGNF